MSEPYSAIARISISRPQLVAYLDAAGTPVSSWQDWADIGGKWYGFDYATDLAGMYGDVNRHLTGSDNRTQWRSFLRCSEHPLLGRCDYDEESGTATLATITFSENLRDILWFFGLVRGVAGFLGPDDSAMAVVRDYMWGETRETTAAMRIGHGASRFVPDDDTDRASLDSASDTVFDGIYDRYTEMFGKDDEHGGDASMAISNLEGLR